MYLLIVFLPFFGALISGFGGRFLGRYGVSIFSTSCVCFSALLSLFAFYEVGFGGESCYIMLSKWIESGTFIAEWSFMFDSLTVVMLVIITFISSLVHIYSIKYMEEDPHTPRFMAFLEVFTFFMLVLVTADNLVQMFVGWEGVGLASYLLINFWYTRLAANQSAIKALIVNRIGDFGLSLSILTFFYIFHSVEYDVIFSCTPLVVNYYFSVLGWEIHGLTLASIFLFIGAVGKSAQLGLHTWLPDAMEGPTPVSALIHAATMVTAGIFLMVRFSPVLEYSPITLFILTISGSLTALFAAMAGSFQNDLKRVIAYSTCSQLGYMMLACGLSCYHVSMFHLSNHAFFKALLFLCAGSVIHSVSDEQDMRKMGSLIKFLPITYSLMLIGSLALTGFPFLTGFYSKDFIMELTQIGGYSNLNLSYSSFACWLSSLAAFFTSFYSFRLIYLTFINSSNMSKSVLSNVHESSTLMLIPLCILGLGSIFIGYLTKDLFIGPGTNFWGNSIFILPQNSYALESEWLDISIKWVPFFASLIGFVFASFINLYPQVFFSFIYRNQLFLFFSFLLSKKWYWDKLYNTVIVKPVLEFGYNVSFKILDRGFIELAGPYGLSKLVDMAAKKVSSIQTGQITHYIFFTVMGLAFFLNLVIPNVLIDLNSNVYLTGLCMLLLLYT